MVRLVEAVLPKCGGGLHAFHRGTGDGPKRTEVGMVDSPLFSETGHRLDQGPVGLPRRTHHELHGNPRGTAGTERVRRPAVRPGLPLPDHEAPHPLEVGPSRRPALVGRDLGQRRAAGRLEIERDPAGQAGQPLDLGVVGSGNQLDVDVPREAMAQP